MADSPAGELGSSSVEELVGFLLVILTNMRYFDVKSLLKSHNIGSKSVGDANYFKTSARFIEEKLSDLKENGQAELANKEIHETAGCLEAILGPNGGAIPNRLIVTYTRLSFTLTTKCANLTSVLRLPALELARYPFLGFVLKSNSARQRLLKLWKDCSDNLETILLQTRPESKSSALNSKSLERFGSLESSSRPLKNSDILDSIEETSNNVNNVYKSLLACSCDTRHTEQFCETRLHLAASVQRMSRGSRLTLDIFMMDAQLQRKYETHFVLTSSTSKSRVRFKLEGDDADLARSGHREISCFCKAVPLNPDPSYLRWNLAFRNNRLWKFRPTRREYSSSTSKEYFSFSDLLRSSSPRWTVLTRLAVAAILAHSLLYLNGTPWVHGYWNRSKIVFYIRGGSVPVRPFLRTPLPKDNLNSQDHDMMSQFHPNPTILDFGIALLEIYLGQRIDDQSPETEGWAIASRIFEEQKENISSDYRTAVGACLDPQIWAESNNSPSILRRAIFNYIVSPLTEELVKFSKNIKEANSLDDVVDNINLITGRFSDTSSTRKTSIEKAIPQFATGSNSTGPTLNATFEQITGGSLDEKINVPNHPWDKNQVGPVTSFSIEDPRARIHASSLGYATISPNGEHSKQKGREAFEIAIICALALEAEAVEALFDKCWSIGRDPFGRAPGDQNAYTLGIIGCHHVVLVHMPEMGKISAASVATDCRSSFPKINLALVVGICGGVPFRKDGVEVLLGDVVISDSIIQYDYGRRFPDRFVKKDTLSANFGRPIRAIRTLLAKLQMKSNRKRLEDSLSGYLSALQRALGDETAHPGLPEDLLFKPTYRHKHQTRSSCEICAACTGKTDAVCEESVNLSCEQLGCDKANLVPRKRLGGTVIDTQTDDQPQLYSPRIHFGPVASGDTVMKSGEDRDDITVKEDVIAFEMEGAGIWDNFPCLIIKGVCDYADSHKNKKWQRYAASTAAASAKAFLEYWN
ncbi:hypothetical protein AJ79_00373 [Helicocarpus griseus UAMH5409]|uniref:Uncharacterized protein n=1 Tax=Helicocarpus griseus UAMH5409 TaxID=1447875 RepID=A0A2B7Y3C3_9EURO|nr:hypothetical protein AJ79_00373 [Helicocarpus griseus UAMH5409]